MNQQLLIGARGVDATGIAYNTNGQLCIYKRPLPAHKLHYAVPSSARYILGHTRMATQGNEKRNYNNHPFHGSVENGKFAFAHNGILTNDIKLRKNENLPFTKIETDSYVAVQLIEKQKALNFGSLKYMAEKVEGSFTFTAIGNQDNLYIIKGSNPFCLYHFSKNGFYLYASTEGILAKALEKLCLQNCIKEKVLLSFGDILKIDKRGKIKRGSFEALEYDYGWKYREYMDWMISKPYENIKNNSYLEDLKSVACYYGYSGSDIDDLLEDGYSCEEIENILCELHF